MRNYWLILALVGLVWSSSGGAAPISGQFTTPAIQEPAVHPTPLVVLVHGMGRTSMSMIPLEMYLESAGYRVLNFHYSSYGPSVADIAADLSHTVQLELERDPASAVHFVGHSLGNIVVRQLLAENETQLPPGRFVMLAPPNRGSRAADRLAPYMDWLLSPISELRTSDSTASDLPALAPTVEFAIIAGEWDSKVSFSEACLPGVKTFAVVPSGHTFILMRPRVLRMVRQFVEMGEFSDSPFLSAAACADAAQSVHDNTLF